MTRILQLELLEELVERHISALGPVRGEGVESLMRHLERQRLVPVQCVVNLQTSVPDPDPNPDPDQLDPHVFGLPDSDPSVGGMDPDPSVIMQS